MLRYDVSWSGYCGPDVTEKPINSIIKYDCIHCVPIKQSIKAKAQGKRHCVQQNRVSKQALVLCLKSFLNPRTSFILNCSFYS